MRQGRIESARATSGIPAARCAAVILPVNDYTSALFDPFEERRTADTVVSSPGLPSQPDCWLIRSESHQWRWR